MAAYILTRCNRVDQGAKRASEIDTVDMLDFLEADPIFHRSGYMKEKLLTELKRRNLDQHETTQIAGHHH